MPSIDTRLRRSYASVAERNCWLLAVVPFVTALLQTNKILEVLAHRGFSIGVSLGIPLPVTTVWTFVSVPSSGTTFSAPNTVAGVGLVGVGFLVVGILTAGYLGSLRHAMVGAEWNFLASVRRHLRPFLGFGVLLVALFVPPLAMALAGPPARLLLFAWVPLLFVVGYLVYAAPYLIVLEADGLVSALTRSVRLTTTEAAAFRYAVGYALLVAVVSLPATVLTVNLGLAGVLVGAAALAPVGLVFDAMTLRFVDDLRSSGDAFPTGGGDDDVSDGDPSDTTTTRDREE